jgi:hypothetical protein
MGVETLAIAGLVTSIAGTMAGVGGQILQGRQAAGQASYQATIASNNAILAKRNAAAALEAGSVREQAKRRETAGLIGAQRAAYAAHGVDVNVGSPVDVQASTAKLGELDALTIRNNAAREAYGYKIEEGNASGEAALFGQQSSGDSLAGWMGSIGSLMSDASSVGDKWTKYQQSIGGPPVPMAVGGAGVY